MYVGTAFQYERGALLTDTNLAAFFQRFLKEKNFVVTCNAKKPVRIGL